MPYAYVAAAIALRLLPHPWNVTPLGAMFLFSGATFERRSASLLVPLAALVASDIAVVELLYGGGYSWVSPFTWLAFLAVGAIGWTLRGKVSALRVLGVTLAGSVVFFLVSNFGVWVEWGLYPRTGAGLLECYAAGLPFFRNSVFGDLFYSALMFGSWHWLAARRRPSAA
jgi:hypothetical protein